MPIVMSCLCSCAAEICEPYVLPQFPLAGAKVAKELENLSAEEYPSLWEWLARLNKLKQELEN
ncbi:MAG: hypothetical protein IJ525_00765 [Alphaproteobacteria bacterium]|nr:hypothetical protein [Alphaproteobacteria bacterium]